MAAKIRPVQVTHGTRGTQLTRRFFKACVIARFRNQFARGQKTIGSHLKKVLTSIINDAQTDYMEGRFIGENIRLLLKTELRISHV